MNNLLIKTCLFLLVVLPFHTVMAQSDTTDFKRTALVKLVSQRHGLANQSAELIIQGLKMYDARKLTLVVQSGKAGAFFVDSSKVTTVSYNSEEKLQLKTTFTVQSVFGGMGYGQFVSLDLDLDEEQFEALRTGNVFNIEVGYSEGVFSFNLNDQASAIFKNTMMLIN